MGKQGEIEALHLWDPDKGPKMMSVGIEKKNYKEK